ncbi:PREDICTED: AF4/FMR2 family member 4-like isoform X2 [Rhagoletis zephyria]|uniref:AF4/FMR2 family member 4-like isoform X2 n=1 Tax=Rhagoletis zephyria TaxID=28612 RepID=UPI00081141CC|nr:PREDICTED: AF4/FMR2 family member 4-like isoform X2 [Rhagoletis zephyria]
MTTKPATISLGISGRIGSKSNSSTASFTARPAHIAQPSPTLAKRGHFRSASLENGNSFTAKGTVGLPASVGGQQQQQQPTTAMVNHTGTLKSRNEQKRLRGQKFGSHSSLDQDAMPGAGRTKFQNIRQIFEITKKRTFGGGGGEKTAGKKAVGTDDVVDGNRDNQRLHLPQSATTSVGAAATATAAAAGVPSALMSTSMPSLQLRQQTQQQQQLQQQQQQQQFHAAYQQHPQLVRKPTPTLTAGNGSGNRSSYSEMSERLSISESMGVGGAKTNGNALDAKQKLRLQHQLQQQQQLVQQQHQLQQHLQAQRQHSQPSMGQQAHLHLHQQQQQQKQTQQQHQQHLQQIQQQQQQQRSSDGDVMAHLPQISAAISQTATTVHGTASGVGGGGETTEQPKAAAALTSTTSTTITTATTATATPTLSVMTSYENLLRPIAFKPIPFEPDYSIQNGRYVAGGDAIAPGTTAATAVGDRYGSTPSLAAAQGSNAMRFGSTSDLRHGGAGVGGVCGSVGNGGGVGAATGGIAVGAYSSNNYCNSLMARRRGSRSLKINDSMESIRHTPDSDANSQSSTIKSTASNNNNINNNANAINSNGFCGANGFGCIGVGSTAGSGSNSHSSNNGCAGGKYLLSEQCDMTPSPSDSGISDLEAALKDRDSELSYLRQTMEHNEKDKENFWEQETKRLKAYYEAQQREFLLKMKKMEQMLAMQQFQFKQHKLRQTEQTNKLREQLADLKNDNEILRSTNSSLKNSERNLKDSVAYIEEQLRESENTISGIKAQLEESEWKVCERNGELALLKSQLKEANVEITMKEHAIVHLRHENTNAETQIYESLQENHKMTKQQKQVEQQQARTDKQSETELKQLNKIIILKDQVILALTNELAKLRKELSDLAIFQEYGEEPSGRFIRLKQQLDNLTDICNRTRRHACKADASAAAPKEKVIDDTNLELIINSLKIAPPLDDTDESENERDQSKLCAEKRLAKMSTDIQNFVYGTQNLPDIAMNHKPLKYSHSNPNKLEESTLDTLIEESASYAQEIGKLRKQLDDVRVNFELEKRQWCEEREKVLNYQKQLQAHYINMYQKLRSLEGSNEV